MKKKWVKRCNCVKVLSIHGIESRQRQKPGWLAFSNKHQFFLNSFFLFLHMCCTVSFPAFVSLRKDNQSILINNSSAEGIYQSMFCTNRYYAIFVWGNKKLDLATMGHSAISVAAFIPLFLPLTDRWKSFHYHPEVSLAIIERTRWQVSCFDH